jgi:ABC-type spermidine/putrescine transport system permease subunit II
MLSGPGMTTILVQIYSMVPFNITPQIHAFSTVIMLFSMTLTLIIINERLIRAKRD